MVNLWRSIPLRRTNWVSSKWVSIANSPPARDETLWSLLISTLAFFFQLELVQNLCMVPQILWLSLCNCPAISRKQFPYSHSLPLYFYWSRSREWEPSECSALSGIPLSYPVRTQLKNGVLWQFWVLLKQLQGNTTWILCPQFFQNTESFLECVFVFSPGVEDRSKLTSAVVIHALL